MSQLLTHVICFFFMWVRAHTQNIPGLGERRNRKNDTKIEDKHPKIRKLQKLSGTILIYVNVTSWFLWLQMHRLLFSVACSGLSQCHSLCVSGLLLISTFYSFSPNLAPRILVPQFFTSDMLCFFAADEGSYLFFDVVQVETPQILDRSCSCVPLGSRACAQHGLEQYGNGKSYKPLDSCSRNLQLMKLPKSSRILMIICKIFPTLPHSNFATASRWSF